MPAPEAQAQAAANQGFSATEKRLLVEILGNGRYATTKDGRYRKATDDIRSDDLLTGDDGRHYGQDRFDRSEPPQDRASRTVLQDDTKKPGLTTVKALPDALRHRLDPQGKASCPRLSSRTRCRMRP